MTTQSFFDLTVTAPIRLARMRKAFAEHAATYPRCPESVKPKSWRDVRGTTYKAIHAYHGGLSQSPEGWYCHSGAQFRDEKPASEWVESYRRHNFPGYYTDVDCADTAVGIVARLTHDRFIAGYVWSSNGERVYYPEVFTDVDDACHTADGHAESFADSAREYSEKFNAARDLENDIETAFSRLRECLALRHHACMSYVRDEIAELCETIRDNRRTLRTEYKDYA